MLDHGRQLPALVLVGLSLLSRGHCYLSPIPQLKCRVLQAAARLCVPESRPWTHAVLPMDLTPTPCVPTLNGPWCEQVLGDPHEQPRSAPGIWALSSVLEPDSGGSGLAQGHPVRGEPGRLPGGGKTGSPEDQGQRLVSWVG